MSFPNHCPIALESVDAFVDIDLLERILEARVAPVLIIPTRAILFPVDVVPGPEQSTRYRPPCGWR